MCSMCRRDFIVGLAATAVASGIPATSSAQSRLPARGEFVIRNAYVMTMDPILGDIPDGSVHVRGGEIVAVAKNITVAGAEDFDGEGMVVLPGLIETHWHLWNTLFRSFSGDRQEHGYFPTVARFGAVMTPDDMYQGVRLAAAEALHSGMTTIHDWCHNIRSREHAERDIAALRDAGVRARFSFGWAQGQSDEETIRLNDLEGLHRDWKNLSNEGLITLGLAWRGKFRAGPLPERVYRAEFDTARRLGIPMTVHTGSRSAAKGQIEAQPGRTCSERTLQLVHAVAASADEIRMIQEAGASVSVAPTSELRIGFGMPPTSEFVAAGIPVGVSVDTSALVGNSSLFSVLKVVRDLENVRALSEFKMTARKVLELGTIEGARSMLIDDKVGSLKPGKRADLIMVDTRHVNMGNFLEDPSHLLIECALPEHVDTVVVDGRVLKRGGKLTALDTRTAVREARVALEGVRKRANWR